MNPQADYARKISRTSSIFASPQTADLCSDVRSPKVLSTSSDQGISTVAYLIARAIAVFARK
jgi:hypothetical protein